MSDYSTWDPFDLLEALELAGRLPDPGLIRALLAQREAVTPGLLDMLSRGTLAHWEPDDPRWYRDVHAGLLLIAFREEAALPVFDAILRDPERDDLVDEWFEPWLPEYGPRLVPLLLRVAGDASAYVEGRTTAVRLLSVLGERHPAERDRIVAALRALLPPADDLPAAEDAAEDDVALWSWTVGALTDLRDADSRDHVRALFGADVLDEQITGSEADYLADVAEPLEPPDPSAPQPDLVEFYETLDQWDQLSDDDLIDTLLETLVEAGADPAAAELLREELRAILDASFEDEDEDVAAQMLDTLVAKMQGQGMTDDQIQLALDSMLDLSGPLPADLADVVGEAPPPPFRGTVVRETPKIGRNDKVTIRDPETGATETLKYKHAQKKLDQGWEMDS